MTKKKVYITRLIPEAAIKLLREARLEVEVNLKNKALTKRELIKHIRDVAALLPLLTDRIDRDILAAANRLKIIANLAVGYNNIDIKEATRKKVMVTNTPGVLTDATADLSWALLLAVTRRIAEADRFVRERRFKGWSPLLFLGADITGKTLGIIGAGRIGTAMALKARGFNMKIIYVSNHPNHILDDSMGARRVSLDYLLRNADFVSVHVPLTEKTRRLIGKKELRLMKETAYLVNTSRGEVVDEEALARTLTKRKIAGAGLDVFENEPQINSKLYKLDNVIMLPHIGSATIETRTKMAIMAARNIVMALSGRRPENIVNPQVLTG